MAQLAHPCYHDKLCLNREVIPMAKDPVCGMEVDPSRAAGTSVYKGETIYFCNLRCKEKFDAEPEKFMSPHPNPFPKGEGVSDTAIDPN